MKHITVTIGIPAFNEEANIGYLIRDLLKQNEKGFTIEKIIVASDGSTDNTVSIVQGIKSKKVCIIDNKDRLGTAARQNQLCRLTKSDYLLLINADTLVIDTEFVSKLMMVAKSKNLDLVSANLQELTAESFFEKVLASSMRFKKRVFETFNFGTNLYTCYGPARLFSKKLYEQIIFSQSFGEDAYSYLYCLKNGMKYGYGKKSLVFYKLPATLFDHRKQSHRFLESQKRMSQEFGLFFTMREYYLPYITVFAMFPFYFLKHPVMMSAYVALFFYSTIGGLFKLCCKNVQETWDISTSTKQIRRSL